MKTYLNETATSALQSKAVRLVEDQRLEAARADHASDDDDDNDEGNNDEDEDEGDGDGLLWAAMAWRTALAAATCSLPLSLSRKVGLSDNNAADEIQANLQTVVRMAATKAATAGSMPSSVGKTGRGKRRTSSKDVARFSRDAASYSEISRRPGWALSAGAGAIGESSDRDTHMVPLLRATLLSGAAAAMPVSPFDACLWCVAATDVALSSRGGPDNSFRLLHYVQLLRALSLAVTSAAVTATAAATHTSVASSGAHNRSDSDPVEPLVVAAVALQLAGRLLHGVRGKGRDHAKSGRGHGRGSYSGAVGDETDRAKRRRIDDIPPPSPPPSSSSSSSSPSIDDPLVRPLLGALCMVADSFYALHLGSPVALQGVPSSHMACGHPQPSSFSTAAIAIAIAIAKDNSSPSPTGSSSVSCDSCDTHHCVQVVTLIAATHQQLVAMAKEDCRAHGDKSNSKSNNDVSDSGVDAMPLRRRVDRAHPLLRLLVSVAAGDTDANTDTASAAAAAAHSHLVHLEQACAAVDCCRAGPLASLLRAQLLLVLGPEDVCGGHVQERLTSAPTPAPTAASATAHELLRVERLARRLAQGLLADMVATKAKTTTGSKTAALGCDSGSGGTSGGGDEGGDTDNDLLYQALQTLVTVDSRRAPIPLSGSNSNNSSISSRSGNGSGSIDIDSMLMPTDKALQNFLTFLES